MSEHRWTIRRGAALLLVLAALVIITSTSVALLGLASTERARRTIEHASWTAESLAAATESPITHWLEASAEVVLPPDVAEPKVEVLDDQWNLDGQIIYQVRITAWDQQGMVPITLAQSGSPLRLSLPDDILHVLDRVDLEPSQIPGLDLVPHDPDEAAVFPSSDGASVAFGALVATHSGDVINVNTAPLELVEAALRAAGRGGLDQIAACRAEGRPASPQTQAERSAPRRSTHAPKLVGASSVWAFRIDVQVGAVRRSWWEIYRKTSRDWERVQRLVIVN